MISTGSRPQPSRLTTSLAKLLDPQAKILLGGVVFEQLLDVGGEAAEAIAQTTIATSRRHPFKAAQLHVWRGVVEDVDLSDVLAEAARSVSSWASVSLRIRRQTCR
jgi:hypothetical protein